MKTRLATLLVAALFWVKTEAQHISEFTSVAPGPPTQQFRMPSGTHVFQYLLEDGDALSLGGNFPTHPDFTGFVPIGGSFRLDIGGLAAGGFSLEVRAGREAVMSGRFAVE